MKQFLKTNFLPVVLVLVSLIIVWYFLPSRIVKYKKNPYDYSKAKVLTRQQFKHLRQQFDQQFGSHDGGIFTRRIPYDWDNFKFSSFWQWCCNFGRQTYQGNYGSAFELSDNKIFIQSNANDFSVLENIKVNELTMDCPDLYDYSFLRKMDLRDAKIQIEFASLRDATIFNVIDAKSTRLQIDLNKLKPDFRYLPYVRCDKIFIYDPPSDIIKYLNSSVKNLALQGRLAPKTILDFSQINRLSQLEKLSLHYFTVMDTADLTNCGSLKEFIFVGTPQDNFLLKLPKKIDTVKIYNSSVKLIERCRVKNLTLNATTLRNFDLSACEYLHLTINNIAEFDYFCSLKHNPATKIYLYLETSDCQLEKLAKLKLARLTVYEKDYSQADLDRSGVKEISLLKN